MEATRPYRTWVELSKSALLHNFGQFKRFFQNKALIAPVVKANAYGHDMAWVTRTLNKEPIWGFCVAYDTEARRLLELGIAHKILVLSAWQRQNLPELIRNKVHITVWDLASIAEVERAARRMRTPALVHMKIDTGTTRIGTRPELFNTVRRRLSASRWLIVEGIYSHYANSEADNLAVTRDQRQTFLKCVNGLRVPYLHLACTAASLRMPLHPTNVVRLGIGLYGLWPSKETRKHARRVTLKPVLSWYSRLLQVKQVPAGTWVGYARTYRTPRLTTIGIVPVGYSDGYDRRASNSSTVVVAGHHCRIIGRVSMNLMAVDLSPLPRVRVGTIVTLIGPGTDAGSLAESWSTIHYEVVSRIAAEIPRIPVP